MKTRPPISRALLWIFLVALALASLALNRPLPPVQEDALAPAALTAASAVPLPSRVDVGSTDGIVLMAVIIVLIVILPILLRRKDWENGRRMRG